MKDIILRYFAPKSYEKINDRIIYEFIGIKWYKKYLPTTGDLVMRRRKTKQIDMGKSGRFQALYKYERKTRNYEWRHLLGCIGFIIIAIMIDNKATIVEWFFLILLNLYVNIFPIFLQKYNRIRIIDLLRSSGKPIPY